jgi:predicted amidohydrolase YtcJ
MAANLIFHNARVITMDKAKPKAQALAISGNRMQAVGTDAEIMALPEEIGKPLIEAIRQMIAAAKPRGKIGPP